jgi:hypothetical protein
MKFLIPFLFFLNFSANQVNRLSQPVHKKVNVMPVWVTYSESVPDSIQDFFKIYLQTKGLVVLTMKEALERIFDQENSNLLNNLPESNMTENEFLEKLKIVRKPVCNNLSVEMFNKKIPDQLIVDSIKWYVLQKISFDTLRHYHTFYPAGNTSNNPYLIWRSFADTVLASGKLK